MRTYYNVINNKTGEIVKNNVWCLTDAEEGFRLITQGYRVEIIKRV